LARLSDKDIDLTDIPATHDVAWKLVGELTPKANKLQTTVQVDAGPAVVADDARRRYIYLVKVKTSVTLPADLFATIDRVSTNRSAFVEREARAHLARLDNAMREARDIEIVKSKCRTAERGSARRARVSWPPAH
jgi:hypothetical protein